MRANHHSPLQVSSEGGEHGEEVLGGGVAQDVVVGEGYKGELLRQDAGRRSKVPEKVSRRAGRIHYGGRRLSAVGPFGFEDVIRAGFADLVDEVVEVTQFGRRKTVDDLRLDLFISMDNEEACSRRHR